MTSSPPRSRNWKKHLNTLKNLPLILRYGLVLSLAIILIKTLEYQLFSYRFSLELYSGLLAVFFLLVGVATGLGWLSTRKQADLSPQTFQPGDVLTAKEQDLLRGLINGKTNQQLADEHHISINTVKTHLKRLYKKLNVSSRAEAVARANSNTRR